MCGVFAMLLPIGVMAPLLVAAMVGLGLGSGAVFQIRRRASATDALTATIADCIVARHAESEAAAIAISARGRVSADQSAAKQ